MTDPVVSHRGHEEIRVLYVDEDLELGRVVGELLEQESDRIVTESVESVRVARERIDEDGVDCLVSAYEIGESNGIDFLESVREDHPDLPFILFTANGNEAVASAAISAGATDYLRKTAGTEQYTILANRIENAVEQYRSERAAQWTEGRLHELAENTPDVQWVFSADWEELLFVNDAYETVYGGTVDRVYEEPRSFLETVHPDDRDRVVEAMERVSDGETVELEYRVNPDEYDRWVEVHAGPVREDGEVVRVVGYSREVTDRKRRERDLERQEAILTALNDAVYALDEEGRFTYVNDTFLELTGLDHETVIGSGPELIKDEETRLAARAQLAALLSEGEDAENTIFELDILTAGDEAVRCEDHMAVMYGGDGEFRGSAGILRDVSDRVERERELENTKRLLSGSLDALDDIFYILDPDGTVRRWNDAVTDVTGYSDETVAEMDALEFFVEEDREVVSEALAEVIETGTGRVEATIETANGDRLPYEFTGARLDDDDGTLQCIIGIGRDVSDRLAYEQTLEAQNDRLEEFASIVSHDLRNPLTAIVSNLELYRETGDEDRLDAIDETAERMDRLLGDLLQIARGGEVVRDLSPTDLEAVVDDAAVGTLRDDTTLECESIPLVLAEKDKVYRLFENLFRNSVEHGGVGVTVRVGPLFEGDTPVGFYVADDGIGVPPEDRERVFETGYTTSETGTGYGLSVVQSVAEAHGWTIEVAESEGGGARFEVRGVVFATGTDTDGSESVDDGGEEGDETRADAVPPRAGPEGWEGAGPDRSRE